MNTPIAINDENAPDWFDLNDWCMASDRNLFNSTKYLSDMSAQRRIWFNAWTNAGQPDIEVCLTRWSAQLNG